MFDRSFLQCANREISKEGQLRSARGPQISPSEDGLGFCCPDHSGKLVSTTGDRTSPHSPSYTNSLYAFLRFCHAQKYYFERTFTNSISIKVGTLSKNAIKAQICNFSIHLNLYLTDRRKNKIFPVFSPTNVILFVIYKQI